MHTEEAEMDFFSVRLKKETNGMKVFDINQNDSVVLTPLAEPVDALRSK